MNNFVGCLFFIIIISSTLIDVSCKKDDSLYYQCRLKNVYIRKDPGMNGVKLGQLEEGERLVFLDEISNFTTRIKLRGKEYNAPWVKVKREDNTVGWVYEATLMKEGSEDSEKPAGDSGLSQASDR